MIITCAVACNGRAATLISGLQQRIANTQAETQRLQSERGQSEALLSRAQTLLAQAQNDGDQASPPIIRKAIAKAQHAIAACDAGISAAKGRVEALTGTLKTVETMPAPTEPLIPSSVVDLREVKDFTIDPAQVKGYTETLRDSLSSKKAAAVHDEIKARAGGGKSNLATMSYAELMASLDEQAQQGLQQGVELRRTETDKKVRTALALPKDIKDDLVDLFLPPQAGAKPALSEQIKTQALGVLHFFDQVRNEEKERVWLAYTHWKVETELSVNRVRDGRLSGKAYEAESKLNDQKFLFTLTRIGNVAELKEDEEIEAAFSDAAKPKGGAK